MNTPIPQIRKARRKETAYSMISRSFIFRFLQSLNAFVRSPSKDSADSSNRHGAANTDLKHYTELPGIDAVANPAGQHDEYGKKRQRPSAVKVNALLRALG